MSTRFHQNIASKRTELEFLAKEFAKLQESMNQDDYRPNPEDFLYQRYLELHRGALEQQIVFNRYEIAKAEAMKEETK